MPAGNNIKRNRQSYVANRIDLVWDDQHRVGAVQNAEIQISFALEPISGIGSLRVIEYIPTMARITVNTDMVYLFGEEVERVGANRFMPARSDDALNGWVFDMYALREAGDNPDRYGQGGQGFQTIWKAQACFLDSGSFRIAKHGAVGRACAFAALDYNVGDIDHGYVTPDDRAVGGPADTSNV